MEGKGEEGRKGLSQLIYLKKVLIEECWQSASLRTEGSKKVSGKAKKGFRLNIYRP